MERLELLPNDADLAAVLKALSINTKATQQGVDKLGINLLKSQVTRGTQSITSTSYVQLSSYQFSVVTSGGLVAVLFCPILSFDALSLSIRVDIDDQPQREFLFRSDVAARNSPTLLVLKPLNSGQHTIKAYAKVDTASGNVGNVNYDSAFYVLEFLKG